MYRLFNILYMIKSSPEQYAVVTASAVSFGKKPLQSPQKQAILPAPWYNFVDDWIG